MIILRTIVKPKFGKVDEMVGLVEKWVEYRGRHGERVAASRQIFSAVWPIFNAVSFHDSIEAAVEWQKGVGQDQHYMDLIERIEDIALEQTTHEFLDSIVPSKAISPSPITVSATVTPVQGGATELRYLLIDWVKHIQSRGATTSLLEQVHGPSLKLRSVYASLGEADEDRRSYMDTPELDEYESKFYTLAISFPKWEIYENIASAN